MPLQFTVPQYDEAVTNSRGLYAGAHEKQIRNLVYGHSTPTKTLTKSVFTVSGNKIEVKEYNRLQVKEWLHKSRKGNRKKSEEPTERRKDNLHRARVALTRLVHCNSTQNTRFVTLTYAENLTDREQAYADFREMLAKLASAGINPSNVVVDEYQERGAVHFHLIFFSLPYFRNEIFQKLYWPHGFVRIKKLHNPDHAASYLTKYFTKEQKETHLRLYSCTHHLKRPAVLYDAYQQARFVEKILCGQYTFNVSKVYTNPYTGAEVLYYTFLPLQT